MKLYFQRPLILALSLLTLHTSLWNSLNAVEDPELDRILKAHVDAMGGWRAWNKVDSIRLTGTIERDGQEVDFCIIKKRPNQIRATITMPIPGNEEEFVQLIRAYDGKTAWTATRLAGGKELNRKPLDEEATQDLLDEAVILPRLIHIWQNGAALEYAGTKIYEGKSNHKIIAVDGESGRRVEFLLDIATLTLSHYAISNDAGSVSRTKQMNYERQDDVLIPTQTQIDSPLTGRTVMAVHEITLGVGIYEDYFASTTIP